MISGAELTRFVLELRGDIAREAELARESVRRIWAAPLSERIAAGKAVAGAVVRSKATGWIHLEVPEHEALFREGDLLFLTETGEPTLERKTELVLEQEVGDIYICRIRSGGTLVQPGFSGVLDFGFADVSEFLNKALDQAMATVRGREQVLPLLLDPDRIDAPFDSGEHMEAREHALRVGLDESQADAFALGASAELVALVQGPPGTGKTRVLSHLAVRAVSKGRRVLVTGLTHRAIDNAMGAIHARSPELRLARIGAPVPSRTGIADYATIADCPWADTDAGFAIGATPFCLQSGRLKGIDFDLALIDEASQLTLPLAVMAMMGARRWVFFGDQCQLPPVRHVGGNRTDGSVFGHLMGHDFDEMLRRTYRLCDTLCRWPSSRFYGEELVPDDSVASARLRVDLDKSGMADVLDPAHPFVHLEVIDPKAKTSSRREAEWIVETIAAAIRGGVPPDEIAVVSPFRRQNRLVRNLLRRRLGASSEAVAVDTVERMQGQEREMVLLSLTSGSDQFLSRVAEFYFQPERLNVAVTRSRTKLVVVGRSDWDCFFERFPDLADLGETIRGLLDGAHLVRSSDLERACPS